MNIDSVTVPSVIGGIGSGDDLTLHSTSHATKGSIFFGAAQNSAYDEVGDTLGIGITSGFLTTNGGVDISSGGIGLILGANNGATTRTNATSKFGRCGTPHITNAEEPVAIFYLEVKAVTNDLHIVEGRSVLNSTTVIHLWTTSNNTNLTGCSR